MKGPAAISCIFFAAWALAAPVVILDQLTNQSDASTHVRRPQTEALPKTRTFFSFFASSRVSIEKQSKILVAEDGQRIQMPDNLAGAKTWETPNVLRFLTSLTHHKKQPPFPESSIMREETRANTAETEPQETIVELETKAERETWTYIPCISKDNVLRFHSARNTADTVMLAIPMAALLVLCITVLSSAIRYTYGCCFSRISQFV